ncbi:diacylglycerol kinase family protein [Neptunitalea lumnitzerae]|uniref:Diacylglycerol kinase n=1 Tax=Neptunitalea lumnitzerae TaxID=2965509 RepID=A0ABQ5ML29_9FLAO|nr:diacylglycerol kinase family protein [Neptunitalea sp. Y10]GLB50089.1 diacylglycerol kinase [Neptunitalea sp. Y10]
MLNFLKNRIKSFGFAFKGILHLLSSEPNSKVHLVAAITITVVGFMVKLSATEWILQTLAIALVISMEAINTAVEKLCDFVHPEQHKKIGIIKDLAAGAVLVTAIAAIIIGAIIYLPKFL